MKPLPWRSVKSWTCIRCGECCSLTVQLTMREWIHLTRRYGDIISAQNLGGFFMRKTINDNCPFLSKASKGFLCGLQIRKPLACKLWPFRVLSEPKYGGFNEAVFDYRNERFYIYVIPNCLGITWGRPTEWFTKKALPEVIDIKLGLLGKQHFSTSS